MQEKVERSSRHRRVVLMLMASAFLVWQVPAMDFLANLSGGSNPMLSGVSFAGFLAWAAGLLFLLTRWRSLMQNSDPSVASALEDELVRQNRSRAMGVGYFVTLAAAALVFGISLFQPISGNDAAHLVLIVAVVAPVYAFVFLERANA